MSLSGFDPLIAEWFATRLGPPTEPQVLGWREIRAGHDVLISAPTGSGKTLAAFLICLDRLVKASRGQTLPGQVEAVYVSPLKALSNDIRKNLEAPLAEIAELAREKGVALQPIRTAVRTGDTTAWARRQMLEQPPHVLVTTPESLFILLTSESGRRMLASARAVIFDEIHATAGDKRGAHLALSLVRLDALAGQRLQRIGLSATVSPIEEVARYLSDRARIVQIGRRRPLDLAVEVTGSELGPVATNELWAEIHDRVAARILEHRTTLVFVNTRRLAERVAHQLTERLGPEKVLAHHGSLARKLRLEAEDRLKRGELQAVVATASLELGIDVGTVDLACQIGSPRSIAVALQRVGRSGHWVGAMPKGRFYPTTRDELIETAALVRALRLADLDRLELPRPPLDILAQQIVAMAACEEWGEDELFEAVRSCRSYGDLSRADFDAVVEMLAEGIASSRGRSGAYLHRDRVNHRIRGRRGARLAAITSGGAIPETADFRVVAEPEGLQVGTLDEDFSVESSTGDIFLLGSTSWRIRRLEQAAGIVRVEDAHGAAPTVPFWRGEAPGRTRELSAQVSALREEIAALAGQDRAAAQVLLAAECGLDRLGADQAIDYVLAGSKHLGAVPGERLLVAERFFDQAGGMQLVIHAPLGQRINRAWGLALRKRFCRSFNVELQAAATDDGLVISLTEQHSFPLEIVFSFLRPTTLEYVLTQALLASPLFAARWRWNTTRALAVLRFQGGKKVPPPIQRIRSEDLLAAVFPDQAACAENLEGEIRIPDHPLVKETISNCLYEAMDLEGLARLVEDIEEGRVRTVAIETAAPSPFSHEILNANPYAFLDDAPLEERRTRAVELRQRLQSGVGGEAVLDAEALESVAADAWPLIRHADELHDALLTLVLLPPQTEYEPFWAELAAARRATRLAAAAGQPFWVAAERLATALRLHPEARCEPPIDALGEAPASEEECAAAVLRGWLESTVPLDPPAIAAKLGLRPGLVDAGFARLEASGEAIRGVFSPRARERGSLEWANRRLLARVHRLTLGRLRREIEPVSSAQFLRFLARWQHVLPASRLHGPDGLLQVLRQLQGYEIPAAAWESEILPRRVAAYEPELLDQLCLAGEVLWGRLSPHPAFDPDEAAEGRSRRVRPHRAAPVTFFLREDLDWLPGLAGTGSNGSLPALSHPAAEVWQTLERFGACFFADLTRATRRLPSEVEEALWELASAGLVTADGFENLRALLDPKRRRGEGRGRLARPRHAAGRWAPLRTAIAMAGPDAARKPVERFARQLLARWGVIFRDLLAREPLAPPWRNLLVELRGMEARGEIRGGRFVAGHAGEQFSLPEAVDLLRSVRRLEEPDPELALSWADPLNLVGILVPGERVSPLTAGQWRLQDGVPVEPPVEPVAIAAVIHRT